MHRRITMAFEFRKPDHVQAGRFRTKQASNSLNQIRVLM